MRAVSRLAIRNLSARPWRSVLLVGAVALSAALISTVACAIASANRALEVQLGQQVGTADVKISAAAVGGDFPISYARTIASWPEVVQSGAQLESTIALSIKKDGLVVRDGQGVRTARTLRSSTLTHGVNLNEEAPDLNLQVGRLPERAGEIVIDALTAERLSWDGAGRGVFSTDKPALTGSAKYLNIKPVEIPERGSADQATEINASIGVRPGDTVTGFRLLGPRRSFEVVGVTVPPPLGGRPQAWMSIEDLWEVTGRRGRVSLVEVQLAEGEDPDAFVAQRQGELGDRFLMQTTARVRSGTEKSMASSQLGFVLISVLCFMSAAFIIMTGLNTGLAEQRRSLAVLRCIGAMPRQLGWTQLLIGVFIGGVGAVVGVPVGVGFAWVLVRVFEDQLPTGLAVPPATLALSGAGALAAGVIGAIWPAWQSTRLSPMAALAARAEPVRKSHIHWTLVAGLFLLAAMTAMIAIPSDGQVIFWGYATVGLPMMYLGYFLLGVPLVVLVSRLSAPLLSLVFGLPRGLLGRNIRATPYRYGFTAGAMMGGLALLVTIWTNGSGFLHDWVNRIKFPDAFVSGIALSPESQARLDALPFVENTSAITLVPVETTAFGVRALQSYKTTFVAFEPESFFAMTELDWIEGDPEEAKNRLIEGGAVIVAREFQVAQGLGVGDVFDSSYNGQDYSFDIVGVVTSPGLELISKFFNVGSEYVDQSLHAVFGSRKDLREKFGTDSIAMIQIDLSDDVPDDEALEIIRETLFGAGVIDAGSGRQIRKQLEEIVQSFLMVFSVIAVLSMLIACFGVANVVAAGIQARQFEFGVLRAMGAQRWLLMRLVVAEAVLIAFTASVLGTLMGLQGAWAGRRLDELLLGLKMAARPDYAVIAGGVGIVVVFSVGAGLPAIFRLGQKSARELLSARLG
jgi:putative ABC transport system permease protein